ncbi:MAG: amidohydrolase [Oscillospiraceae bacterium]|nr:amidohydrolase [Oscillospiraceae bacterium]
MKTVYYNGAVYTGELPLKEAFAVSDDKFVFAGSSEEALSLLCEGDEKIDLEGKFVCPGFIDSHMHILNYGLALSCARLDEHTQSLEDMIACLKQYADAHPSSSRISGRGWNQDYFTDVHRMPNRYDLDKVSADKPVFATRACGHAIVVNSAVIKQLGITADTPQPDGGMIGMENGEPNGLFFDSAIALVAGANTVPGKEEVKDMIKAACKSLNSYGITSCHSDDYSTFSGLSWQTVNEAYRELEESGELTVRVYEQSNFSKLEALREFVEAGNITGRGTAFFKTGPLKMLGDGSLGSRTALLSRPYADDASTSGLGVFTQEEFDTMIGYAHSAGMQTAVHAIGDACLDRVLSAVEKSLAACPRDDHRHGIVHCQITRPDQLEKIAALNMHVYAQSIFLDYDIHIVKDRVGEEMASSSYSWKTLIDKGASVSNGSDCPVELPFALGGIQCAVTRRNLKGDCGPYLENEAFSVKEALDSFTSKGAHASFEENIKGKIEPGMLADFVILGQNIFECDCLKIKDIPVNAVFVGGKKVL